MKIARTLAFIFIMLGAVAVLAPGDMVAAQASEQVQEGVDSIGGEDAPEFDNALETIVNAFLFLIGSLSVVMIVYGGFRYVTSAGDSSALSAAKNTILYAVVGLVIALGAYAISDFVIDIFTAEPDTGQQI